MCVAMCICSIDATPCHAVPCPAIATQSLALHTIFARVDVSLEIIKTTLVGICSAFQAANDNKEPNKRNKFIRRKFSGLREKKEIPKKRQKGCSAAVILLSWQT